MTSVRVQDGVCPDLCRLRALVDSLRELTPFAEHMCH